MRKLLKRLGWTLSLLFVLLNIIAAFHAHRFTHFYEPEGGVTRFNAAQAGTWEKLGAVLFGVKAYKRPIDAVPVVPFDTLSIQTADGIQLAGWLLRHDTAARGTVIMFHGHGSNRSGVVNEAHAFYAMGYRVLLVDFRAHGESSGTICTIGYDEAVDVKAAYAYVTALGEKNTVLWGISLGAAAVMRAVDVYALKPASLILEMPFGSLMEAVKGRCRIMGVPEQPTAGLLTFWGGVQQGFWAFDHNPDEYALKITCPVLLQWGAKDLRVSEAETRSIFSALPNAHKSLVVYTDAGHQSLLKSDPSRWNNSISQFLAQ